MSEFLSELALGLNPYTPGEQPKGGEFVKLNTNENPYPPSPVVMEAIRENTNDKLRLYPDPESTVLLKAAADYYDIPVEMVFAGNGSDEVLAFAFAAFYAGRKLVFPKVTYSFYPVYCRLYNVDYTEIAMVNNLRIDTFSLANAGCGAVIANPNAPTGELISLEVIEDIAIKNQGSVILIDEAYIDFGGKSAIGLIRKYENILVVQTFSKSRSLAGMRIGFAFGNKKLIDGLNRVKNSFNSYPLDRISQYAGAAAFKDEVYYIETREKIIKTRERSIERLADLGFETMESSSNFIFTTHATVKAERLYRELKERMILVRYFGNKPIDNYIRITIGTDGQMDVLFNELEKIISDC
ncbi:MAG: histidinol-phosphate transaminase [Clostridia bacterium]|nr:histidinol-phosphate transaminase [Clostridia bacterium]